jgi:hypothetical protein
MLQWINAERTVLVRCWPEDEGAPPEEMEVATREDPDAIWGPPVSVRLEADRG